MNLLVIGICCLVIALVAAALNGARIRIAQHRTTMYPNIKDALPKWWPSQKHLAYAAISFNWLSLLVTIANCILVITVNHPRYLISYFIAVFICIIVGKFTGIAIASATIKASAKKHGVEFIRECL